MELLQWDFHATFSRQEEFDEKLPSSDIEQCLRMGVFCQKEFKRTDSAITHLPNHIIRASQFFGN